MYICYLCLPFISLYLIISFIWKTIKALSALAGAHAVALSKHARRAARSVQSSHSSSQLSQNIAEPREFIITHRSTAATAQEPSVQVDLSIEELKKLRDSTIDADLLSKIEDSLSKLHAAKIALALQKASSILMNFVHD